MNILSPAEHIGRRPKDCTAERCYCKWLKFQMRRENARLKKQRLA